MKKIQSQLVDSMHNTAKVMELFANDYAKAKTKERTGENPAIRGSIPY